MGDIVGGVRRALAKQANPELVEKELKQDAVRDRDNEILAIQREQWLKHPLTRNLQDRLAVGMADLKNEIVRKLSVDSQNLPRPVVQAGEVLALEKVLTIIQTGEQYNAPS